MDSGDIFRFLVAANIHTYASFTHTLLISCFNISRRKFIVFKFHCEEWRI